VNFDKNGLVFETLLTRMEGSTLVLTFNRPEVRNAISWTMEREFFLALQAAERLDEITAVVLNGAGEMFSAGHDLIDSSETTSTVDGEMWARQTAMLPSWNFSKPLIAAVHKFVGPFTNGILLTFDFIIAAEGTRFSFEHSRISVGRPWGPYPLMYFMFPPRVVYKLWALGGWMSAEQAHDLQYVQRVVPMEELESTALHWAQQCSIIDPEGFKATKKGMHEMYEAMGLPEMVEIGRQPMRMPSPAAIERNQEFSKTWQEQGIKAALALRDADVDPEFTQV
jgi:enoyl-CoA hydratase/carnithine racemase